MYVDNGWRRGDQQVHYALWATAAARTNARHRTANTAAWFASGCAHAQHGRWMQLHRAHREGQLHHRVGLESFDPVRMQVAPTWFFDTISDECSRAQPLDDTGLEIPALNLRGNSKQATLGHCSKMADLGEQAPRDEQGHSAKGNPAHRL